MFTTTVRAFHGENNSISLLPVIWHDFKVHRRSSRGDVAQNALRVVEAAIGGKLAEQPKKLVEFPAKQKKKNPAAVALGRLGGQKGGRARAAKLSASERKAIAQRAAQARWARKKETA